MAFRTGSRFRGNDGVTSYRPFNWIYLVLAFAIVGLLAVACGGGSGPAPTASAAESGLTGNIEIDGSSTVFPISQAVAEEFRKEHPKVQIPVGISGTGGGFKRFTVGETDISDASRPIKDSEREQAAENGVEFIQLTVAFDGLSILVNPDNDFVTCMTTAELKKLWEPRQHGQKVERDPPPSGPIMRSGCTGRIPTQARSTTSLTPSTAKRTRRDPTTRRAPTTTSLCRASQATETPSATSATRTS